MLSRTWRFLLQIEFQVDNNAIPDGVPAGGDREQHLPTMRAFEFGAPSDSVRMSPAAAGSYYHDLKSTRTSQGRFDPKSTRPASSSHLRATMMCCVAARASPSIRSMGHSIIFRV